MKLLSQFRSGLLVTSACAVLAACSGSGDNSNQGNIGPVTVGGGNDGGAQNAVNLIPDGFTCPSGTSAGTATSGGIDITACVVPSGTISADLTLPGKSGATPVGYALQGSVFVGDNTITNPGGATAVLTIEPGAVIVGQSGEDALFVSPGSQLIADGTLSDPIIFTSLQDIAFGNGTTAQERASDGISGENGSTTQRGQFGGLALNGLAPINDCDVTSVDPVANPAGCNKTGEGGSGLFGGGNPNDNSGILNFVRVQFGGFRFSSGNELNGIAFQGVGDATDVDFIQVHNNVDDGVEFFGGTVDANHVIITGAGDDSIDWTDGWTGSLQYGLVVQDDTDGDNGIEGDNRGNDTDILPRSNPNLSNLTFFAGATGDNGFELRAGTAGNIANAILIGWTDNSINFNQQSSTNATPTISSVFAGGGAPFTGITPTNSTNAANNSMNGVIPGAAEQAVTATDPTTLDASFDAAVYVGAFDPDNETNSQNWTTGWSLGNIIPAGDDGGCPSGTATQGTGASIGRSEDFICILPNLITSDLRLTSGNIYSFIGTVFVGEDAGADAANPDTGASSAVLSIDPGVTIYGRSGEDAVVVSRGSQIQALGTDGSPIIFTSEQDVLGEATARGQFGGLVINGRAPINDCDVTTVDPVANPELCEKTGEGGSGLFGGNSPTDNSGVLNFVQVRNGGFRFSSGNELNGIAFQGVGSATEVDFIQVDNNVDDGVEFFGGTVNAKHIVLTGNGDDSLDWTDGWTGNVQYVIIQHASDDGDNGFEGDNRSNDTDILPRSNPTIANVTFLGDPNTDFGAQLRAGTDGEVYNMVIAGSGAGAIDFTQASSDTSVFTEFFSSFIASNNAGGVTTNGTVSSPVFAAANGNVDGVTNNIDSTLTAAPGCTSTVVPGASENAVTASLPAGSDFFDSVTYIGAVENAADDWYVNWTLGLCN